MTTEQKYELLRSQVIWEITHFGIVDTEGIFEHLSDTLRMLEEPRE